MTQHDDKGTVPIAHDFTKSEWGHAVGMWFPSDNGKKVKAVGHGTGILVGHVLLVKGPNGGMSPYYVRTIRYYDDPTDMWEATLEYAEGLHAYVPYQRKGFIL